ncbi:MAG: alpha/beta hydrolase [Gammaproteobacteria bacterium]|nr:alpha/beta hydrolase [Gammaproteobacteria bacterium]
MTRFTRVFFYILTAYTCLTIGTYFFSDALIFPIPPPGYHDTQEILKITTKNGAVISAVYLPNTEAKYTVLVSHGNAEDLGYIMPFLKQFHNKGFAIFAYDYQGYGTSTGKPTAANAYTDSRTAYNYLTEKLHVSPSHIIVYGRSLGAAVAINLAVRKPVAGLIMESPFLTAYRAITQIPIFMFDKFRNIDKIQIIKCPVLIIHGKKDTVIPFWQGKKLYDLAPSPKSFLWIDDANHNDVASIGGETYWKSIQHFSKTLLAEDSHPQKTR